MTDQQGQPGVSIEVENLTLQFGGVKAISSFSFRAEPGELAGVIGPNGAGKSSLFNCLSGAYRPTSGRVLMDGQDITRLRPHQRAEMGLARTFQNLVIYPEMSVMENLLIGAQVGSSKSVFWSGFKLPRMVREERQLLERAEVVADALGLTEYLSGSVMDMPYGVQKRLDIGRILLRRPRLLLLDEPLVGMTRFEKKELVAQIRELHEELKPTILIVEHDVSVVMELAKRIVVMNFGAKLAEGSAAEIKSDPRVIEAYLGSAGEETVEIGE